MIRNSININNNNNLLRVLCGYFLHYRIILKDKIMKNVSIVSLLFIVSAFTVLSAEEVKKEYHEKFSVTKGMTLSIRSGDGDVTISPWDQDEVKVDIVYHADHRGNGDDDRSFEVEFDKTSRTLHIIAHERTGSRFGVTSRHIHRYTYDIKAPDYLMLDLDGDDGNMVITGWKNNIECTLDDGDLNLEEINNEETYLRIGDGDLKINKIKSDISIWADDGDVEVTDISAKNFRLEIKDGSGILNKAKGNFNIRFDDADIRMRKIEADQIDIRGNDGQIELELAKSSDPDVVLETDDGPIRLFLDPDISAELSIETDDGDFSVNLSNEIRAKEGKNWYQGTINDGKGNITIRANDGSVKVRDL